jgi:hypothetical protein
MNKEIVIKNDAALIDENEHLRYKESEFAIHENVIS